MTIEIDILLIFSFVYFMLEIFVLPLLIIQPIMTEECVYIFARARARILDDASIHACIYAYARERNIYFGKFQKRGLLDVFIRCFISNNCHWKFNNMSNCTHVYVFILCNLTIVILFKWILLFYYYSVFKLTIIYCRGTIRRTCQ